MKGGTDIVEQLKNYYSTRSKSCRWVIVALSYMVDTARVNGKTVWCLNNDSDISSTPSYDFSWNLAKALALPHVIKKFEWLGIQRSFENKNVSWNSAISRLASTESREKIHRNPTKEKMSITHGQSLHKERKGQCPKINWTVPIMLYQYLPRTLSSSLPWLLTMKSYFLFHIHCA